MCYKDEVQRKNANELKKKLNDINAPQFIKDYFYNLNSEAGKLHCLSIITDFLSFLIEDGRIDVSSISEITEDTMKNISKTDAIVYLDSFSKNDISPITVNNKKNILGSFWSHLECEEIVNKNIIRSIPKTKFKVKDNNEVKLPREEMIDMINNIQSIGNSFIRERNLIIIEILKDTGLRESELIGLDIDDLYLECEKPYLKVLGKGFYSKTDMDTVLLSYNAKIALEKWLMIRNSMTKNANKTALFVNTTGKRMTEINLKKIFRQYSDGKIHPHMMRHLCGTVLYYHTKDISFVQKQLRHASVNTTIKYYVSGDIDKKIYAEIDKTASQKICNILKCNYNKEMWCCYGYKTYEQIDNV